jgi:hypothetical protein
MLRVDKGSLDMPTLEFKGKQFVYSHHLSVPFRELKVDAAKSLPAEEQKASLDDNLIIHGDNLEALKALAAIVAGNKSGKRSIVFAVAKFMSQKELTKERIEFCQLPYAVHRILGA